MSDQEQRFMVLDSTEGVLDDSLTYADAVALLNEHCAELTELGWTVEYGWASGGNYAAARASLVRADGTSTERMVQIEADDEDES